MVEAAVRILSRMLRLVPDSLPGKGRIGRMLLRAFWSTKPATLSDRAGCVYRLPSYAEPIAQEIFSFGAYEQDTQELVLRFLPEAGTFVDVGANVGALSIPISKARPRASIVCVEADPKIHKFLQRNIIDNQCSGAEIITCVAGATDGDTVAFYPAPEDKFGMGSVGPQFDAVPILIKQRSLDAIQADLKIHQIDLVKIDVEGGELGVLLGAQRLLASKQPPTIVFEFADWAEARIAGQQPGDAQALLLSYGYRIFRFGRDARVGEELLAPLRHGFAMLVAIPPDGRFRLEERSTEMRG